MNSFTVNDSGRRIAGTIDSSRMGAAVSVRDMYGYKMASACTNVQVHDANFAFLTTSLAKLHKELYEPKWYVTWREDIDFDTGGAFVDFVEWYSVDWAGIMNQQRNIVGNGVNYIPRVNAGINQERANVYTYEVAYDLRFIELEKMKKLTLQKSIQQIYNDAIVAGWDLFVQDVAYTGIGTAKGLFNSDDKVLVSYIPNTGATGSFFTGMSDASVVSFFNGIFQYYLENSNQNIGLLPDRILVPMGVINDLTSRISPLYNDNLYNFIINHNMAVAQDKNIKVTIVGRKDLDGAGVGNNGRIVAYRKDKSFVRIDIPYPIQHYITLPNIDKMAYTSAFVGQVSQVQLPYNTNNASLGVVTYWDFQQ